MNEFDGQPGEGHYYRWHTSRWYRVRYRVVSKLIAFADWILTKP